MGFYNGKETHHKTVHGLAVLLWGRARSRCRRNGREFTIRPGHVLLLLQLALDLGTVTTEKNSPELASLDRIENGRGYVPGNIQIVPFWYNCAKSTFPAHKVNAAIKRWVSA